jgi:hypothetical protein
MFTIKRELKSDSLLDQKQGTRQPTREKVPRIKKKALLTLNIGDNADRGNEGDDDDDDD